MKNNQTSVTAAQEWARYPDAIKSFVERLRYVLIEQRPALHLLKLYDRKETLFYLDPPYLMSTTYVVLGTKREKVKQYGNAVTPPVMQKLIERCMATFQ